MPRPWPSWIVLELWFDVSLADLGQRIARILDLQDGGTGAHLAQINSERWHGFRQLEKSG